MKQVPMKLVSMMDVDEVATGVGCHRATPYVRKTRVDAKQTPYQKTGTVPVTPDTSFTQTHTSPFDTAFIHSHSQSMTLSTPTSITTH
jgi:hypothetical protein